MRSHVIHGRPATVLTALFILSVSAGTAFAAPAGSFEIPAWAFDHGNAKTFRQEPGINKLANLKKRSGEPAQRLSVAL